MFLSFRHSLVLNRRKIVATGMAAFVGGVLIGAALLNLGQISRFFSVPTQSLLKFSSYEELVNFVNASSHSPYYPSGDMVWFGGGDFALKSSAQEAAPVDYSTTNIQVAGVDEADIVKSDGDYLYVVSNQSVFILLASPEAPEEARILSRIELNGTLHGIFLDGDRLVVFGSTFIWWAVGEAAFERSYWPISNVRTFINVYDVADREEPALARNVTLDGAYFNSRMIGDYVYTITNEPAWFYENEVKLPIIYTDSQTRQVQATDIYYFNTSDYSYSFTTITAVNAQNDLEEPTDKTILLGATRSIYVSLSNIYLTLPGQRDVYGVEKTLIHRVHVEAGNIESEATGEVPGSVLNQFSMDEHSGYFRIATTTGSVWGGQSKNHVYILDMDLEVIGKLEGLASGEKIYSARFMGDKFYLVTFRKVDPLFVIDLTAPENPVVLGELKVTGYSDYLHPYDLSHVIGVGKETEAAESDDFSWYQGVKISLFDVSNPLSPQELSKDEIGDRGTQSPVLNDHKAFLFDKEKQLLAIPVLVAEVDEQKYPGGEPPANAYGEYVWQGAIVYTITLQEGLVRKGNVTHIENGDLYSHSYYYMSPYSIRRILYIEDVLYTISERKIMMNSLSTLNELMEIEIPK